MSALEDALRCAVCFGRRGECADCGGTDYCLHWRDAENADERQVCVGCDGTYSRHAFAKQTDEP